MCTYVRALTETEGKKIQEILRKSKNRTAIRRAQVILMSEQGYKASEIAESTYLNVVYVRELIRRFNSEGNFPAQRTDTLWSTGDIYR
jgi:uncharacterized protein YllA (UPF0747 family)